MIRVLIADDHDIVRSGLKRLLEDHDEFEVVGEAADAKSALRQLRTKPTDVVVLDVNMPNSSGPETVAQIRALPAAPRVVVFTMYHEDSHAVAFLRAGAGAFISKRRASDELLEAIRRVHSHGRYITPSMADYLFAQQIDLSRSPADLLSPRELEVVRGLAAGQRAIDIAEVSGLSASTVNTYVQRIKEKLGVRTAVEIVQFAQNNNLLG